MRKTFTGVVLGALLLSLTPPASAASGDKSPVAAGLLGGLIGLGTGYYYAGNAKKGLTFTLVDIGIRSAFLASASDDNNGLALASGSLMLVSALYQGIDGAAEAGRRNRRRGAGFLGMDLPLGFECGPATLPGWDSSFTASLWAKGGADRDRALAASLMRDARQPVTLSLGLGQDTSVGVGWSTNF